MYLCLELKLRSLMSCVRNFVVSLLIFNVLNLCAQQRLAFEPAEWDFGTIDEAAGP